MTSMMITHPYCSEAEAQVFSLAGICPSDIRHSRNAQAREVFEKMEAVLQDVKMTFAHVVRTWFHLDDILAWYGEFNAVRNAFFAERHVFRGVVPASTGVGVSNEHGAALTGAVLAVKPLSERVKVFAVPSPLQCPAMDYQSFFSRAVEVHMGESRRLYISGTASIDEHGATVCHGNLDGQIRQTLTVVEAILKSRQLTWAHANRAVAYFSDVRDAPRFRAYCCSRGIPELAVTPVQATMCRAELLFELELDAGSFVRSRKGREWNLPLLTCRPDQYQVTVTRGVTRFAVPL